MGKMVFSPAPGEDEVGAPTDAWYVTMRTEAGLSQERVLTGGDAITVTDGGAGSTATVDVVSGDIDHNDLGSKDTGDFQHLTSAEHDKLVADGGVVNADTLHVHDADIITYTPAVLADWDDGVDPGDTDDALDQLAANMGPLLPSAAPVLDNIDWSSTGGVTGANTWNDLNTITDYITAATAGSVNNSGDALDINMGTTGNEHGIMAVASVADKAGYLNTDVVASDNYPDEAFGPGGADGGSVNDLKLLLNGSILHTVDLLTFGSGTSVNGNGSGFFSLLDDTPVYFPDLTPFPARTYRTGGWYLDTADMTYGYNVVKVQHVTDSGTQETNVEEFILDNVTVATTYTNELIDTLSMTGALHLSGVEYHTGGTAEYDIQVRNAYRETYDDTDAISFSGTNIDALAVEDLAASGGDEAKIHSVVDKAVTISSGRIINGAIVVKTSTSRTVQTSPDSTSVTITGLLMDSNSASSTALIEYFTDENYRIEGEQNFNGDLTGTALWTETESLVGADAGHLDGLQVTEGSLYYPGGASISDYDTTQAPASNPDYGAAAGKRFYWRYFTNATGTSSFRVLIQGDRDIISDATAFTGGANNEIKVALRWATETGWLDLNVEFNEGDFGDTTKDSRYGLDTDAVALTDGCHSTSLDSGSALGVTIGTKTSANSYDNLYLRILTSADFNGQIDDVTVTWNP